MNTEEAPPEESAPSKEPLSTKLTKKGTLYEGECYLNGEARVKFMVDGNMKAAIVVISKDTYKSIASSVTAADFTNDKQVDLGNGEMTPGDVFQLFGLQLGDKVFSGINVKISSSLTKPMIIGKPVLDEIGCSINEGTSELNCK